MCVGLVTAAYFAVIRLVARVHVRVLFPVAAIGKPSITAIKLTFEGLFPCVRPLVDFKILGSGKNFSTARERAGERFLSGVHANVIHKFVFSFKRFAFPRTLFPKTDMVRLLGSSDVLHRHMRNQLVHGAVSFGAKFFG